MTNDQHPSRPPPGSPERREYLLDCQSAKIARYAAGNVFAV